MFVPVKPEAYYGPSEIFPVAFFILKLLGFLTL